MNYLLKQTTILDQNSPHHQEKVDILIADGKVKKISGTIDGSADHILELAGAYVSVGWMDVGVQACDPGFEQREDLYSLAKAAAAGGFTALAIYPNTEPVIHSKSEVLYIKNRANELLVDVFPIGAISRACEGGDITEMYDMHETGAIAFSDGERSVQNGGLMMRALQYVKAFDSLIINHPYNSSIAKEGQMHEGTVSTMLGMKGIPNVAEEMMIQRDLQLLAYTGSKLHFSCISTAGGVALIREAKKEGLGVSASVALNNLLFDDSELMDFNTLLKMMPPIRSKADQAALKEGLKEGTIDFMVTNHVPHIDDEKKLEFPYAAFGAAGLQTAFSNAIAATKGLFSLEELVNLWTIAPRKRLQLPIPVIKEGVPANLTVFDPDRSWTVQSSNLLSRSKNNPMIGSSLQGKILATFNKGMTYLGLE